MSDITRTDHLAGQLYTAYCEAVGGKAFNGLPLPAWPDFVIDKNKSVQVEAWRVVARTARSSLGLG